MDALIDQRVLHAWKQLAAHYSPFGGLDFATRVTALLNQPNATVVPITPNAVRTRLNALRKRYVDTLTRSVDGRIPVRKEVDEFEHFDAVQDIILASRRARRAVVERQRTRPLQPVSVEHGSQRKKSMPRVDRTIAPVDPSAKIDTERPSAALHAGLTRDEFFTQQPAQACEQSVDQGAPHIRVLPPANAEQVLAKHLGSVGGPPQTCGGVSNSITDVAQRADVLRDHVSKRRRVADILPRPSSSGLESVQTATKTKKRTKKSPEKRKLTELKSGKRRKPTIKGAHLVRAPLEIRHQISEFESNMAGNASKTLSGFDGVVNSIKQKNKGAGWKEGTGETKGQHVKTLHEKKPGSGAKKARGVKKSPEGEEDGSREMGSCTGKRAERLESGTELGHERGDKNQPELMGKANSESTGERTVQGSTDTVGERVEVNRKVELDGSQVKDAHGEQKSANKVTRVKRLERKMANARQETRRITVTKRDNAQREARAEAANVSSRNAKAELNSLKVTTVNEARDEGKSKSTEAAQILKQAAKNSTNLEAEAEVKKVPQGVAGIARPGDTEHRGESNNNYYKDESEAQEERMELDDEWRWNHTKRLVEELRKSAVVMRELEMTEQAEACMKKVIELLGEEARKTTRVSVKQEDC